MVGTVYTIDIIYAVDMWTWGLRGLRGLRELRELRGQTQTQPG